MPEHLREIEQQVDGIIASPGTMHATAASDDVSATDAVVPPAVVASGRPGAASVVRSVVVVVQCRVARFVVVAEIACRVVVVAGCGGLWQVEGSLRERLKKKVLRKGSKTLKNVSTCFVEANEAAVTLLHVRVS